MLPVCFEVRKGVGREQETNKGSKANIQTEGNGKPEVSKTMFVGKKNPFR